MKYAEQRMLTLNEHCVICDERHVFQNGPMLKVQAVESNVPSMHNHKWGVGWRIIVNILICVVLSFCLSPSASSLQPGAVCLFLPHPGGDVRSYRCDRHWRRGRFAHISVTCGKARGCRGTDIRVSHDQISVAYLPLHLQPDKKTKKQPCLKLLWNGLQLLTCFWNCT